MRVGSATHIISSSAQIDPGVIVDSDVNAAAAIEYSKLNSGAINAELVPDGHVTRDIGDGANRWRWAYITYLDTTKVYSSLIPQTDVTYDLGNVALNWNEAFINKISGNAAGQIMVNGLLGGMA